MIAIARSEFSQEKLDFIDIGGGFFSPMRPELQAQFPFIILAGSSQCDKTISCRLQIYDFCGKLHGVGSDGNPRLQYQLRTILQLKPGDYVVFDNVGAYTNVLRPPFINPAPPILSYSSKHEVKVIRRRETTDDIFSSYSFTAFEQGEQLDNELDLIIDAGIVEGQNSTIISCTDGQVEIIRQGIGEAPMLA
jgi:hypothetical protein